MRRVLEFCSWKATWWEEQIPLRQSLIPPDQPLADSLQAYAHRQATSECAISATWRTKWRLVRQRAVPIISAVLGEDWILEEGGEAPIVENMEDQDNVIELEIGDEEGGEGGGSDYEY